MCKIGNLGKLKYEAEKKRRETRKKEQEVKTLKIRPGTAKHDLDIDVRKAKAFLEDGDKVKLECRFRSREMQFPQLGKQNLDYIVSQLEDIAKVEKGCEMQMRSMIIIIAPK